MATRNYTGIKKLNYLLEKNAGPEQYLFSVHGFSSVFHELSFPALKMLFKRAVDNDIFKRVCRGVYLYDKVDWPRGLLLYHTAAKLRNNTFNYISLESALSDAGIISQMPLQWLTLMSGGRSNQIDCGSWGTIEFVHTRQRPEELHTQLVYDRRCRLWRATVSRAISDMKNCRRPLDLINWSVVDELV